MIASFRRRSFWPLAACLACVVLTAFAFRAGASAMQSAKPISLGVINIEKVINSLDELDDQQGRLDSLVTSRRKTVDEMSKQLEKLQGELELIPEGNPQRIAKGREIQELSIKLRLESEVAVAIIDAQKGEIYAELFRKISDASKRFAERNGYDMVLSSDAIAQTPQQGTEAQIKSFIVSRRVIFASPGIDVTDQLITMMNNEYKAGANGAKGP
ncbi:MAG: OmpH family outer membrane protein [Phycisphaerales bacterium]